ncbi:MULTISPECIES: L-rhamnose/proton symporter RhaT [Vibrio]|uniref:Rhamnose/proton symporter RhaT n=2 Tax=Vibrio TaxID=662 RepID=A0A7X4LPF3_9VIBR|nr:MULTISPECIES: L-rhamnose/proton symporter RhaT [Vibrio]MBF9000719.1 L-rhamnose/proton symporter RhaT [Vibrio nitrifigilis]MZI95657.1 rhamnose/proton symporter RhaT [Vibrio eleionomae]
MSVIAGIGWHMVGAASAAAFYAPYKKVQGWSWELMWSIGGVFSWVLMPWLVTMMLVPNLGEFYSHIPNSTFAMLIFCGAMWGIGNITYGLTMRYLGMSMGIGIAIGLNLAVGTLLPPFLKGQLGALIESAGGSLTMIGIAVALVGIAVVAYAGNEKEKVMGERAEEFNLKKGIILAIICGIFSAGFAFGLNAAGPIKAQSEALGINYLYVAMPAYGFIMGGGAIVNFLFCAYNILHKKEISVRHDLTLGRSLLARNLLFTAMGGIMWYLQFFFYGWGEASVPARLDYINWMLHMSCYVLFGGIIGLIMAEWKGVGTRPVRILIAGLLVIIGAANIVGLGMAQ